ncbi:hypothetical protein CsSME_00038572 [Camellia sinensis var. sinensis]
MNSPFGGLGSPASNAIEVNKDRQMQSAEQLVLDLSMGSSGGHSITIRSFATDMAEEGGDLQHPHLLTAGGDERLVIPKSHGVCHRRVPLGEEILKLSWSVSVPMNLHPQCTQSPLPIPTSLPKPTIWNPFFFETKRSHLYCLF